MTGRPKSYKVVRAFERHKVEIVRRINHRFHDLPRYKRVLMITQSNKGPFSKLEIIAGIMPQHTDPRTGLPSEDGKRNLNTTVRMLNQNGYKEKYPFAKVYSIPYVDEDEEKSESSVALVRYYLVLIYGNTIKEVIHRMQQVIDGITKSIASLEEVRAAGARKLRHELEKYRQQIEYDQNMVIVMKRKSHANQKSSRKDSAGVS